MLHIFYRTCALENAKARPPWYSKARCFVSMLEALNHVPSATLTVVADGSVDAAVRNRLPISARLVEVKAGRNSESFLATFAIALTRSDDDVVYFVEDDYIHIPTALLELERAFEDLVPDYVTLYDHPDRYMTDQPTEGKTPPPDRTIYRSRSHGWRYVESTCSTFAARVGTLKKDLGIILSHVVQGRPQHDRQLFLHLQGLGPYDATSNRRRLLGALPSLATHCETAYLAPGVNWELVVGNAAEGFG